jgi:nitronate monooxygenase
VTEDWLLRYKRELSLDNSKTKYPPALSWESGLDIALNHGVRVVIFTQGLPDSVTMKKLKAADVTVIATATHLVEAIVAEEIGCDAVIAQGMEAGGERATFIGKVSDGLNPLTMLIPLFVDHLEIPVIASGGIGDVRGAYAMLGMGAQGMQIGTIFIPSPESGASPAYKQAVLNSLECSTTISRVFSGRPARVIINRLTRDANRIDFTLPAQKVQSKLMRPLIEVAREMQVTDIMPLYAGISAYMASEESVSEVLDDWAYALTEPYREDDDVA